MFFRIPHWGYFRQGNEADKNREASKKNGTYSSTVVIFCPAGKESNFPMFQSTSGRKSNLGVLFFVATTLGFSVVTLARKKITKRVGFDILGQMES